MPQRLWSLCHAFCSGPVYTLPAHFGGITPLAPGFAQARISPRLGDLENLHAAVPTLHGVIDVRCDRSAMSLRLPPGIEVHVTPPGGEQMIIEPQQSDSTHDFKVPS